MKGQAMRYKNALMISACMILCSSCSHKTPMKAPSAGLIEQDGAGLFYIFPSKNEGIIFFHYGQLNSSASHTANPKNKTYNCTGILTTKNEIETKYQYVSSDANRITINNSTYNLDQGRCFQILGTGEILQLPFAPLDPSEKYAVNLKKYFKV